MNELHNLVEPSQLLLNNGRDLRSLIHLRRRLLSAESALYEGDILSPKWGRKHLGETYDKVVLATRGVETAFQDVNEYTTLGGWCVLRTFDTVKLTKGLLTHPITNKAYPITDITNVAEWIVSNIALDQIVETVGYHPSNRYVAISEVELWTKKIVTLLEGQLEEHLTPSDTQLIQSSIENVELQKYQLTQKYLEYIAGGPVNLTRVVDSDIFDELIQGRDRILTTVGLSIEALVEPTLARFESSQKMKQRDRLIHYIQDYSIAWFLYTGEYLKILQKAKYVITPKALLVNPWKYALNSEIEGKQLFGDKVFQGQHAYLRKGGINENIGFIALDQPSTYGMKRLRTNTSIANVPNIKNYRQYISNLRQDEKLGFLDISQNQAFQDTLNFFPYARGAELLTRMIHVINDYKNRYKALPKQKQHARLSIREQYSSEVYDLSQQMITELELLCAHLFNGN